MAGVDTSIYSQVAQPPDPFALTNKLLGVQQTGIENQLLGRNLQAQQGRQQALSDAYDPQTGQFDVAKYYAGVQGTPAAQYLPEDIQQGQKIFGTGIANAGAQQDYFKGQMTRVGQAAAAKLQSLDPNGPDFGVNDGLTVLGNLKSTGVIDTPTANTLAHLMPRDAAGAKQFFTNLATQSMPNGGTDATDLGIDPVTKAPVKGTGAQNFGKAVGTIPAAPGVTPAPAAGYSSALPPGANAAANLAAEANAQQGIALQRAADAASGARATLGNMESLLPKIDTGPNAESVNTAKAGANAIADMTLGKGSGPRFNQDSIAASEEFRKLSGNLIAQQQQALGGTDAGFSSGKAQTPNLDLSSLGNKRVLQMLQGNQDAIEAKNSAWQKWLAQGNGPNTYGKFAQQFNNTFSPRAFQWAHMDPADQREAAKSMTPQDRAALGNAMATAERNGWIKRPGAAAPAGAGQ